MEEKEIDDLNNEENEEKETSFENKMDELLKEEEHEEVKKESVETQPATEPTGTEETTTDEEKTLGETTEDQPTVEETKEIKPDDITGTYTGVASNLEDSYFHPIGYINDGMTIDQNMEKNRQDFNKVISKAKVMDIVSIVLMLLAFAGVIVTVFVNKGENKIEWLTYVVLGVALAIIVVSFLLTSIFSKKNTKCTKEYLVKYEDLLNGYVISDLKVVDPTLCVEAKANDQDIIQAHYFHTINKIESRAVVEGKRMGRHFSLSEVAVVIPTISIAKANKKPEDLINLDGSTYVPSSEVSNTTTGTAEYASCDMTMVDIELSDEVLNSNEQKKKEKDVKKASGSKQTETATGLFGKIYSYDMCVESEESFIIAYMGSSDATVLPDNLTGFKAVHVPGVRNNIVIYCINPKASAKFFDEEGVNLINAITPDMVVQSMFISINSYGSKIGMNLSDDIMQLPIKQLAHLGSYDAYKNATDCAFNFVDYVEKKLEA